MRPATIKALRSSASITATDNGPAVNVSEFTGNGYVILNSSATGGPGQTSDVKLQHSDDGTNNWSDADVAFAQVTNAGASFQSLYVSLDGLKKFVRVVNTLAGSSPTVTFGVAVVGDQQRG